MQVLDKGNLGYETLEGMTWNLVGEAMKPNPDGRPSGIPAAFSSFRSSRKKPLIGSEMAHLQTNWLRFFPNVLSIRR